jgi:hypothetical protein
VSATTEDMLARGMMASSQKIKEMVCIFRSSCVLVRVLLNAFILFFACDVKTSFFLAGEGDDVAGQFG